MNLEKIKKIHFIGVGGSGISAVAKMMLKLGKTVSGSDLCQTEITDKLKAQGAKIIIGHDQDNLANDTDLVIYSAAVPVDNSERFKAGSLNILELSYGEFLGQLSSAKKTMAVTGTNGKTTTSAILGKVLVDCGLDPTVIIGSQLNQFAGNLYLGQSEYLALEADEYKASMLNLQPWSILLTSIEKDHLDFYKDLPDIIRHFQQFINKLPQNGYLFYNADDPNIKTLTMPNNSFGCSLKQRTDYWVKETNITPGKCKFTVNFQNKQLGEFCLKIPGEYNILNALLVIGLCHQLNLDLNLIKQSLAQFGGLWRRFEMVGNLKNNDDVLIISDYTHHPAAIEKTLNAAKQFYPDRRIFLVYQPHQADRTIKLFHDFIKCFTQADFVVLNEIYDVAGRNQEADQISSNDLVKAILKNHQLKSNQIIYSPNLKETERFIKENVQPHDLLLIMGAGDIDDVARHLVNR